MCKKISYNMTNLKSEEKIFSKILPQTIYQALTQKVNYSQLNEVRLRVGKPIVVALGGENYFLSESGITNNVKAAIVCTKQDIENIVFRASECSIYAVNEQIKQGFLTIDGGIRIGIAGTAVCENEKVKTIKNFSSLVIRIPHKIKNCSLCAFNYVLEDGNFHNTLIVSPPGCGKTTFLRDFLNQLSERNICLNILTLDERGEIAGSVNGESKLLDSNFCDVFSYITKSEGFLMGIRALSPSVVVCDEIGAKEDYKAIEFACNSGVGVIATAHASSIFELKQKPNFEEILRKQLFERYVVLSSRLGPGTFEGIYDKNFSVIQLGRG